MIILYVIAYILLTIIFYIFGDGSVRFWQGFDLITLLLAIILPTALLKTKGNATALEKTFLNYSLGVTFVRLLYTALCVYAPLPWVYENTNVFILLLCVSFTGLLIYTAIHYHK